MSTSDCFTDANGNVRIDGQEEPALQAVGFVHRHPCPLHAVATVAIGKPNTLAGSLLQAGSACITCVSSGLNR